MNIAICDDKRIYLDTISQIVSKEFKDNNIDVKISTFISGNSFLANHEECHFDIVFLDILMPEINGFKIADKIRQISQNTYIVFITTESSLVFESFDYKPFYFIPKGDIETLSNKMHHVINKLIKELNVFQPIGLELPYGDYKYILPKDIIYI